MLMLKRQVHEQLKHWYLRKDDKKALMIVGARQVGKTTSVREFAKEYYESVIEINFEQRPTLNSIFDGDLDADTLLEHISVAQLGTLIPHRTLLFFDEIQSCPAARTSLKFLVEDGRYDVIASGSLLGLQYKEVSSFPVGFEEKLEMYSLDFEEFLWAHDISEEVIDKLRHKYEKREEVDSFIHTKFLDLFKRYMIVGGMPAVVSEYLKEKNIQDVIRVQQNLVRGYRDDISKYAGKRKGEAKKALDSIPLHLMKPNKKFVLGDVEKGARHREYESALHWLIDAHIGAYCFNLHNLEIPLPLYQRDNIYKFFMRDTGLLSSISLSNVQQAILSGNLHINEGAIVENAIADLLLKRGYHLFYYDRRGRQEIDFVITHNMQVIPLEIKGGNNYKHHPSLTALLTENHKDIKKGMVLCPGNVEVTKTIDYLSLYMVMFL